MDEDKGENNEDNLTTKTKIKMKKMMKIKIHMNIKMKIQTKIKVQINMKIKPNADPAMVFDFVRRLLKELDFCNHVSNLHQCEKQNTKSLQLKD